MHTSYERYVLDGVNPISGTVASGNTEQPNTNRKTIKVRVTEYDMKEFLVSCVEKYCELANVSAESLKRAPTPFLDVKTNEIYDDGGGRCKRKR